MSDTEEAGLYEAVLGARFERLSPQLRRYFADLPEGSEGRGVGTYTWAGPRYRALHPIFRWLAWRRILFPERGRDVPFTIRNWPAAGGARSARREFRFPGVTRVMEDTMLRTDDRLGRRRGLEVALELDVRDGGLTMRSRGLAWRIHRPLRLRLPLPRIVRMSLDEREHPSIPGSQCVDVRLRAPLLGEFFRYSGVFEYAVVTADDEPRAGKLPAPRQ